MDKPNDVCDCYLNEYQLKNWLGHRDILVRMAKDLRGESLSEWLDRHMILCEHEKDWITKHVDITEVQ